MDPGGMCSTERPIKEEQNDSYGGERWGLVLSSVMIKIKSEEEELCLEQGSIRLSERLAEHHQSEVKNERLEVASCAEVIVESNTREPDSNHETPNQMQSSPFCPGRQRNTSTSISKEQHYQCHTCRAQFIDVLQLTLHAKTHRRSKGERSKVRKCRSCCKVLYHSPKKAQRMDLCEKCSITEMSFSEQDGHDAMKDDDPITVIANGNCLHNVVKPKDTSAKKSSIGHVKHVTRTFTCQLCGQIFVSVDALERHCLKSHKAKETFKCKVCKKRCSDQNSLDLHIKTKHTVARPFICQNCGKSYYTKSHLEDHMSVHSKDKLFQCSLCHKKFQVRRTLYRHRKICTGYSQGSNIQVDSICSDIKTCQYCSEEFMDSAVWTKHVRECQINKLPFCELCNMHFTERSSLTTHYRVHTGYKPHKCDYCKKCFSRGHHLKLHLRLHTGENPFPCDKCSKSFKRRDHLKLHFQRIHALNKKPRKVYSDEDRKYACKVDGCNKRYYYRTQLCRHKKIHEQQGIS